MERTFFLTTARTGFSTWRPDDRPLAHLLWGNPRVGRYICKAGRFTPEEVDARFRQELDNLEQYQVQYWPVFSLETGELIGCCGMRPHDGAYNLGFQLRPEYWGQGYATECGRAAVDYAFRALHIQKLVAGHHPDNAGSRKVLEKLGFTYTGDELYPPTGLMHPGYVLLPEE